jgi:hypothetical protein
MLLTACDDLSRSQAENLIRRSKHFPVSVTASIPKVFIKNHSLGLGHNDENGALYERMRKDSLLIFEEVFKSEATFMQIITWTEVHVKLASKALPYFTNADLSTYSVKLYDNDFGQINSMLEHQEGVRYYTVDYTLQRINPTPFMKYFDTYSQPYTAMAKVIKYDNGWDIPDNR